MEKLNPVLRDGVKIIRLDWLCNLEIMVLYKKKAFYKVIENLKLEGEEFADDWNIANGSVFAAYIDGIPLLIMSLPCKKARTIVHECVHMAQLVMDVKGIPLSADTAEVLAYTTDYLFSQIYKKI